MTSACVMLMGLATFGNAPWGNRLPSVLGPSATDTGAMATAGTLFGAPAMWMAGFIGGLCETALGASGARGCICADRRPQLLGLAAATIATILALTVLGHRLRAGVLARGALLVSL